MNKHGKRRLIVSGVAGAALVASSFVGVAAASALTGSVPSNGATGSALRALATISPAQASAAAVAAVPGTAGTPELIYDQGYVVYRVIVTAADGTRTEVIVDGGSAVVLSQYAPVWSGVIGDSSAGTDSDAIAAIATATAATATAATTPSTSSSGFTGSVLSNGATGSALDALATVTQAQASAAAVAAMPGTAGTPELIYDNGYVVYRVIVTAADGTRTEVIVDAGNATVLAEYAPNWSGTIGDSSAGTDSDAVAATGTATAATATAATTPSTSSTGFTGSIQTNGATGSALRALATVTETQASAAAVAAVPGTADTPELIYDNGYAVYRVIVTASDGTRTEVIVDAGNSTVLAQYAPVWSGTIGDSSAGSDVGATAQS